MSDETLTVQIDQLLWSACLTTLGPGGTYERVQLLRAADSAGLADCYVVCTLHNTPPMTLQHFVSKHYVDTERSVLALYGRTYGPNVGCHAPGDLRLAYDGESYPAQIAARDAHRRQGASS